MANSLNNNQNNNSIARFTENFNNPDTKDTYETMGGNASNLSTTMTLVGHVSAEYSTLAKVLSWMPVGFEILDDWPNIPKGLTSGVFGILGGTLGLGWGIVQAFKENDWRAIFKYSGVGYDAADRTVDKWFDDITNTFKNIFHIGNSNDITTGQAANIAESDPFLSEGVFNGQILDGQKVASYEDEIWGSNKLQGSYRISGALQGRVSKNQSFLESFGLEDMHKQNANLYNFANGASLNAPNSFPQDDTSGQSFLESLGLPDFQKQYASLSTFGGYGLNLIDNSRTIFQTDIAPTSEAIGTSGSVLFNNNLGGVNSSETYTAGISQTSSNDQSQDGMLLGVGAAGFFFNPAALIVVAVGFIVSWLNSIFCRD